MQSIFLTPGKQSPEDLKILKRGYDTIVFFLILQNFLEHIFWRTPAMSSCLWTSLSWNWLQIAFINLTILKKCHSVPTWIRSVRSFITTWEGGNFTKALIRNKLLQELSRAHSEPSRTSAMELFAKMISDYNPLIIFAKKLHRRCSTGFWISFWLWSAKFLKK